MHKWKCATWDVVQSLGAKTSGTAAVSEPLSVLSMVTRLVRLLNLIKLFECVVVHSS